MPAAQLQPNPKNWRTHPQVQQDGDGEAFAGFGHVANASRGKRPPGLSRVAPADEVPVAVNAGQAPGVDRPGGLFRARDGPVRDAQPPALEDGGGDLAKGLGVVQRRHRPVKRLDNDGPVATCFERIPGNSGDELHTVAGTGAGIYRTRSNGGGPRRTALPGRQKMQTARKGRPTSSYPAREPSRLLTDAPERRGRSRLEVRGWKMEGTCRMDVGDCDAWILFPGECRRIIDRGR